MKTCAKLGDQLGLNLWTAKSKYGATIQTALDYTIAQNPKNEDVSDIFPHVAAVAAAYGDPSGKYDKFLKAKDKDYGKAPYYFYNTPKAFRTAPTTSSSGSPSTGAESPGATKGGKGHKGKSHVETILRTRNAQEKGHETDTRELGTSEAPSPVVDSNSTSDTVGAIKGDSNDASQGPADVAQPSISDPTTDIPFECPMAFAHGDRVQLDDGIYTTCNELKPFYDTVTDAPTPAA